MSKKRPTPDPNEPVTLRIVGMMPDTTVVEAHTVTVPLHVAQKGPKQVLAWVAVNGSIPLVKSVSGISDAMAQQLPKPLY